MTAATTTTTTAAAAARTATRALLRGPARRSALRNRGYHSHAHPPQPSPFSPTEAALLRAAYARVPEHGFTAAALGRGARDAGLLDVSPAVLPDGPVSLIRWHLVTQREALAARAEAIFSGAGGEGGSAAAGMGAGMGVGAKVQALAWERLMGNKEINHRWQEALAIMAQPSHVPFSVRELALLADEMRHLAGDAAVDASWYARRASLGAAYAASELFMTADRSAGFAETRRFLGRRVGEAEGLGAAAASVGQWVGFTFSAGVNVLRSKGVRI